MTYELNRLLSVEKRRMIAKMARRRTEIDEIGSRIRALLPRDQQAVMRQVLLTGLVLLSALPASDARGDGVANVLFAKGVAPATVELIDPERGCSSGGGGTDVRVAPGDVLLFRFHYFPVPDKILHGLQGYLTEYVPANTEVVGIRLIDDEGLTIPPRFSGIATDGCGRPCAHFNSVPCFGTPDGCNLDNGSISQVHADTGVFFSTDPRLERNPNDAFLTFDNGILMSPDPSFTVSVRQILHGLELIPEGGPFYSHNAWDWIQVRAYGTSGDASTCSNFAENSGVGNTPFGYGSPVAGPDTHYEYEATEVAPCIIEFNEVVGPWQRITYPGSQLGIGTAVNGSGPLQRMNVDTAAGFDVTPNTPLPSGTRAVRLATGELRVGRPGRAEVALRVLAAPLDPVQNEDVNCGETVGGDPSAANENVRAKDNAWPVHVTSPVCARLNLLLEHDVDRKLTTVAEEVHYTIHGKNLSTNPHTNVVVRQKYHGNRVGFISASGGAVQLVDCEGDGLDCLQWPTMTLQPSDEYDFSSTFQIGGGGQTTVPSFAKYTSDQLPPPGFTTQTVSIMDIPVVGATLGSDTPAATPGGTADLSGTLANDGVVQSDFYTLTILMPPGWTVVGDAIVLGGTVLPCTAACGTHQPEFAINDTFAAGESRALSFSANVPGGTATALHPVDLQLWAYGSGFGGSFESYYPDAALVAVGAERSQAPQIDCPIASTATSVSGTTTEADGTIIRLYVNGIERGSTVAGGGTWTVTGLLASFGPLYGGLEVRATAQSQTPDELESERCAACFVRCAPYCPTNSCGDGCCTGSESSCSCPADCSEECGDGCCGGTESTCGCAGDCGASCGDGCCNGGETACGCTMDCPDSCGDGCCTASESNTTCAADCPASCPNGICDTAESECNCPDDCTDACGDGCCTGGESGCTCPEDCLPACGDGCCSAGETPCGCSADCGDLCGDGCCTGAETPCQCPADCAPACGDGCCNGSETECDCPQDCADACGNGCCGPAEDSCNCAADCPGACCGDDVCGAGEDCGNCPTDCGACTEPGPDMGPEDGSGADGGAEARADGGADLPADGEVEGGADTGVDGGADDEPPAAGGCSSCNVGAQAGDGWSLAWLGLALALVCGRRHHTSR